MKSTSPDDSSNVDSIRTSRAQALIETICLILGLKQPIQDYLSANSLKLPSCAVERLNYAYIKAIESVAKSFLSRCLPYDTQDELTKYVAEKLALQSRDLLLTTLIEMALCSLRGAKSDLIKKCALKILVHLTVTKPYVPPETQEMHIKYFKMGLPALISLKDYICSCITQVGEGCTDRPAIKSMTQLMCEFDTMSDRGEVLDALYTSIMGAMASQQSIAGLCSRISDLRGVVEGTYRQRQFMSVVKRFIQEEGPQSIRDQMVKVLDQPINAWT